MECLNYHHLFYFWNIVREGSIRRASQNLRLAQPTLSQQLRVLEQDLGEKLFERVGKKLVLTEVGQSVYRYAEEIFSLGREMQDAIKGRPTGRPLRLVVGLTDAMPKLIAYRLLEPALRMAERPEIVCYEDRPDKLVAELAASTLDLVLSDSLVDVDSSLRVYNHLLGESAVTLFATSSLAEALRPGFPTSLDRAPMLLPTANTLLRRSIEHWLDELGVTPRIAGEFEDSALMAEFGDQGAGVFPAPSVVEDQTKARHGVEVVGRIDSIRQSFYAISVDRRIKHPAVSVLTHAARSQLFRQ